MKLLICSLLVTLALGDRLDNTYLPPSSARTAGGSGSFLATPHSGFGGSSSVFRSSSGSAFGSGPANAYVAPASGNAFGSGSGLSGQYDVAASRSYSSGPQFRILRYDADNKGDGSYQFQYETENQISQREAGEIRHAGGDQASSVVRGTYSYTAPDGQHITVNYIADENGFRAEGDHLPTPPPIPEEIKKSLAINAASGSTGSGSYGGNSDSGAYDGVEINAASRSYLAPAIARASQGSGGYRY